MNIVDPILFQSSIQPRAVALCAPGTGIGIISYRRLVQMIHNICGRVTKLGIGHGSVVAIEIEDPIFCTAITLALARLGIVTLSRYDELILRSLKVDALIADKYPSMPKIDQIILTDLSWTRSEGAVPLPEGPKTSPDDLCRLVLTSGTTGNPKAVPITHRLMGARIARHDVVFSNRFAKCSRIFSDLPISTSLGFQFLLGTLWRGGPFFFPGKSFDLTIDAFEEYKVQGWLSSPGGLEVLLRYYDGYPSLQSEVELISIAGDIVPRTLSDRVRTRICPHLVSVYGSTEASMTATSPVELIQDTPDAVGILNPGISIEIINDVGIALPPGSEGIVRIKSPYAADHYVGDPEASARAFRDGWFYPGDVGMLDADNVLRVRGRYDAVLNLGGDKINSESVEAVLASCDGVVECAVFSAPNNLGNHEVIAVIVTNKTIEDAGLRTHCGTYLSPNFIPTRFIHVAALPRNAMGKVDRKIVPTLDRV